jgi:hypothetical protein
MRYLGTGKEPLFSGGDGTHRVGWRFDIPGKPGLETLAQFQGAPLRSGIVRKIYLFAWILFQVIELVGAGGIAMDVLPVLRPHHPDLSILAVDFPLPRNLFAR